MKNEQALEEKLQQERKAKKELQVQAKNDHREKLQLQGHLRDQDKVKQENVELQAKVQQLQQHAGTGRNRMGSDWRRLLWGPPLKWCERVFFEVHLHEVYMI